MDAYNDAVEYLRSSGHPLVQKKPGTGLMSFMGVPLYKGMNITRKSHDMFYLKVYGVGKQHLTMRIFPFKPTVIEHQRFTRFTAKDAWSQPKRRYVRKAVVAEITERKRQHRRKAANPMRSNLG